MADDLDGFLKGPEPEPASEAISGPEKQPSPTPATEPENQGDPSTDAKPEGEAPPQQQDGRTVPLAALEGERKARQDWKDRAARAEAERDAHAKQIADIQRQLDEARRPQQPQQAEQPQFIDPRQDPDGFLQRLVERDINVKLNTSEMLLRREIGADAVAEIQREFKAAAEANPALAQQLYREADPYAWARQQVEALKFQKEIGGDPNAYREKLRAEIMAEMQGQQAPQPQRPAVPQQAPSLARANSAAPRSAVPFTGPPALEDVLGRR